MKPLVILVLFVTAALGHIPGPETHEAKWHLPGLTPPVIAAESSHDYDVRHYRIDLDLPMTDGSMTACCAIRLRSNVAALDSVFLNFVNLTCDSVKLGDDHLRFVDSYQFLNVFPDPPVAQGDSVTIDIHYRRSAATTNRGFYWYLKGSGNNRNHTVAYSITQPENSRYWFPCWDQPWDKAEAGCMVNITVPDSFTACANGLLDSVTTSAGKKTFWWTHRYPVSTYLINFAASIFSHWVQYAHIGGGDSIPVENFVWPEDSAQSVIAFAKVPDMVEFFSREDRFGRYPFPEEKYGHVAVFPFSFGGMEHQTMTTVHRYWILYVSESGIAHELAHMWYGDYITCQDWREIWLNEGSASYLDPLWFHHCYGRQSFEEAMQDYATAYFQSDAQFRRPLYDPGLNRMFDWGHTYCKAAWVNHMTRYLHGDTVFDSPGTWFESERAWADSFAYGTGTTHERQAIQERWLGDMGWFYDEWVFMAGFPNYTVNWFPRETADGWEIVIDVGQDNGAQAPDFFRTPVEVLVSLEGGGDTLLHWGIEANPQRDAFPLRARPVGIVFDPGKWLLHKVSITSGVEQELSPGVGVVRPVLHAPAPNPARGRATVRYSLPHAQDVALTVRDVAGRLVRELESGRRAAGHHEAEIRGLAAGVYLVRLEAGPVSETRKLVIQ
ncbi:MAG TPA: T9SS type A sorting domain-containing protein [candidate division WOR-3 bacterium]|uniref:Aminopeptidase N n=1 Tax=candidate division WOR-3 bacterium TaxID=2052148 RepID=A0A7V0T6T3_UNCW3|nr:T9SS type A sorting domain-containing protein [candidate division WOR-3 bacterium]